LAGQIVQAIIVPEGGDIELLKELFGEDFSKIEGAEVSTDGTSQVYTLAQKSDFSRLNAPVPIGDTAIKAITGEPLAGKADAVTVTMPLQDTAATITHEREISFGELLDHELYRCFDLIFGAFSQMMSTADQRRQIVMAALDALRAFLEVLLAQTGNQPVAGKAEERRPFGASEFTGQTIIELRKIEKRLMQKLDGLPKENQDNGGIDMNAEETTALVKEVLCPLTEKVDALALKFDESQKLKEPVIDPNAATVDPNAAKTEPVSKDEIVAALKAEMAPLLEKVEKLETAVADTAKKADALQHQGNRVHTETEDPRAVKSDDPRLADPWNQEILKRATAR
jgi:hypothetical protein